MAKYILTIHAGATSEKVIDATTYTTEEYEDGSTVIEFISVYNERVVVARIAAQHSYTVTTLD